MSFVCDSAFVMGFVCDNSFFVRMTGFVFIGLCV